MRLKKPPTVDPDTSHVNPGRRTVTMETVATARTAANKIAFLEQFKIAGTITAACRAAGINRDTHYEWLAKDAQYVTDFEEAAVLVMPSTTAFDWGNPVKLFDAPYYYAAPNRTYDVAADGRFLMIKDAG